MFHKKIFFGWFVTWFFANNYFHIKVDIFRPEIYSVFPGLILSNLSRVLLNAIFEKKIPLEIRNSDKAQSICSKI